MEQNIRFSDLGLSEPTLRALDAMGFTAPTPVQAQTIPLMLDGTGVGTVNPKIGRAHV